jgi:tetrahydromethanopterin S-methyltransferase subunit E
MQTVRYTSKPQSGLLSELFWCVVAASVGYVAVTEIGYALLFAVL